MTNPLARLAQHTERRTVGSNTGTAPTARGAGAGRFGTTPTVRPEPPPAGIAAAITAHDDDPNAHGGVEAEVLAARSSASVTYDTLRAHLLALWQWCADHLTTFNHALLHAQNTDTHTDNATWGIGGTTNLLAFREDQLQYSLDGGVTWIAVGSGLPIQLLYLTDNSGVRYTDANGEDYYVQA